MPLHLAKLALDDLSSRTIGAAIDIHRRFGPGLFESVYERLLAAALRADGLDVRRQKSVSFEYRGKIFKRAFRIDLLVEHTLIVELKSIEIPKNVLHKKQLLTYLRLTKQPLGLVINFGAETLRDGVQRIVNNLEPCETGALTANLRG